MSIHSRSKSHRTRLGMTEQQLADSVGVTRAAVQQWEREGGTAPRRSHQAAVAKTLQISLAELLGTSEELQPQQQAAQKTAYLVDRSWPFLSVTRQQWESLSQRAKGEIEGRILEMTRSISGSGSGHEKGQKIAY